MTYTLDFDLRADTSGSDTTIGDVWLGPADATQDVHAEDSFDRPNSTTTLGNADTGETWATQGTWGINSNRAYTPSSVTFGHAQIETGEADCEVEVEMAVHASSGNAGVIARWVDANNYLVLFVNGTSSAISLGKVEGGSFSRLVSDVGVPKVNGTRLRLTMSGSTIIGYYGAATIAATSTFNQTATRHGLWQNNNANWRLDNFSVREADPMIYVGRFSASVSHGWRPFSTDVSAIFNPAVDMVAQFRYVGGNDTNHWRRIVVRDDAAGEWVSEYPQHCQHSADELDGIAPGQSAHLGQMYQSGAGAFAQTWNTCDGAYEDTEIRGSVYFSLDTNCPCKAGSPIVIGHLQL